MRLEELHCGTITSPRASTLGATSVLTIASDVGRKELLHQQCPRLHLHRCNLQRPHPSTHRDLENRSDRGKLPIILPSQQFSTMNRRERVSLI